MYEKMTRDLSRRNYCNPRKSMANQKIFMDIFSSCWVSFKDRHGRLGRHLQ